MACQRLFEIPSSTPACTSLDTRMCQMSEINCSPGMMLSPADHPPSTTVLICPCWQTAASAHSSISVPVLITKWFWTDLDKYDNTCTCTLWSAVQKSWDVWEILKMSSDIYENTQGAKFIVLFGSKRLIKSVQFASSCHICADSCCQFQCLSKLSFATVSCALGKYVTSISRKDLLIDLYLKVMANDQ